jgi:hypothetical protein
MVATPEVAQRLHLAATLLGMVIRRSSYHPGLKGQLYRDNLVNDTFDELYHANGATAG